MAIIVARPGIEVLVDDDMLEKLSKHAWRIDRYGYARTSIYRGKRGDYRTVLMHRMVLGIAEGDTSPVDHADSNPLNNTRANLRLCTPSESSCNRRASSKNTSGFKGVFHIKEKNRWKAQIGFQNKTYHLGMFDSPEEAYAAYQDAAKQLHGEFANFGWIK